MAKREDETQTGYALRVVREAAWQQVDEKLKALRMDDSAVADEHKTGFAAGYRQAKRQALDVLADLAEQS